MSATTSTTRASSAAGSAAWSATTSPTSSSATARGRHPPALTDYIKAREGYDYSHHGRVGNPDTEFVPDEIVERFCVLGTVDDHIAKLRELEGLGVDQFNIYLMHDAMDATLEAMQRLIPRCRRLVSTRAGRPP
jgi:alkanesulfonate monooxygenase SsuD/methylene tetrahydromethanopterin reductase-like flavin-dependent oxidoreductase (luciferase family)